ncbi:hypothetical protein PF600_03145 [Limosilactobacillus fermentum]|nr:hypothetical protein [Limosilactobacillus fermentum]
MNFINLSSQQAPNDVNWAGLVNSGVQGVLIRLGHGIIRDPCASGHIAKAKQYGLYWHGYHTYEGVVNEPQFTIKNATELGLSTSQYYFADLTNSSDPFNDYYALHANWLSEGYSTGLLISNEDYLSKFTDSEVTASGSLRWLISDTEPANYDIWQYSSEGTIGTSSVKIGFNFAKTDKLKYNLSTTLTGADINKDPYNPQAPVGGAYIGWGYDTTGLGGGKTFGYSTNGKNFYALVGPKGLVVRKSDGNRIYGTIADQIDSAISANVIPAKSAADSAVAYANDAIEKSKVNSQAIDDINSAVSDAKQGANDAMSRAVSAWDAAQSNVDLIDSNYASASASISSARTEALAAADEAKKSASAAQADIVVVKSSVAAVQAGVATTRSDVAVAKSDIADTKAGLTIQAKSLSSYAAQASAAYNSTASALSDAKTAFSSDVAETKKLANTAQATADSAVESASENAKELASQANALSDAKKAMDSDVASAKELANAAQATADSAVESASSVANNLAAVASQANANANGITKVTSDVGLLQTTVADNTGDISTIQETAKQIQQAVSDNSGNITVAKQTADSAVAVASDAKSNATVAVQTASGASLTATNAQGDATTAMTTANSAVIQASDAKSNATVAVQTASEASLTAANAKGDASIAKQTASDASVQIKNAQGDISKLQTRAGAIETSVANNSGAIADVQATANRLKASVSDNSGAIVVATQTAQGAATVASDAKSNATVAIQTASQASITASNASGQAAGAVITANGAMTTASDAKSDATVAVQTASGASLTAINANSDATVAKQTASEAKVQASNAESDFAQLSIRAGKIEASVANNSGAIASVQQTANGLTTTVADIKANGGGVNLLTGTQDWQGNWGNLPLWGVDEDKYKGLTVQKRSISWSGIGQYYDAKPNTTYTFSFYAKASEAGNFSEIFTLDKEDWSSPVVSPPVYANRAITTEWQRYSVTFATKSSGKICPRVSSNKDGITIYVAGYMLEKGTVAHDWSPAPDDLQNQFTQTKQSIDGITTIINDPKTGLNATYQTASGNATTISTLNGDVSQLKVSASSASVALSDAAGNISSLKATASDLQTKYANAANDISQIKTDAQGMTQTISNAQGDIAQLKTRADGFDAEFATANGNISKLQTDATGTTQTLANTKSDVAVLQSRADGLDAKYADAAGDINTLKTNASGFSQTLTNAQGDISTLKSTVSGVQTTLTNAQGNISTLQSDVSGLKKTTSDNAGNISTLQSTANTLTSQMSSAQGDISTLKQTASGISSQVSGMSGDLNNLKSQAQWVIVTDTVDLNNIKTPCHEFLKGGVTNAPNETAWWYLTVEGSEDDRITQTVIADQSNNRYTRRFADSWSAWVRDATQTDVTSLSNLITANTTAINQNKNAITLKADQTAVDKINGTVSQLQSSLTVQAEQIQEKVTSSQVTGMLSGYATQDYTQSLVTQKANDWNLNLTNLKTDVNAIKTTGGGVNLTNGTSSEDQSAGDASQTTGWQAITIATFDNPQAGQQYTISVNTKYNGGSWKIQIWDGTSPTQRVKWITSGNNFTSTQDQKNTFTFTWPSGSNKYLLVQLANGNNGGQIFWNSAMLEEGTVAHTWSPAPSDIATVTSVTNLSATVDGIKGLVKTKADQSEVTQLSNLVQSKVSSGDFTSTTTQLKNMINQRVQVGDVISQINQEAGGDTLIQVSNGKGSFVLDASNTIMTGKAWIPDAAISSISADKVMLGSSSLWNSDGTLNLLNQSNGLKALIQVKQGLVQNTIQSIISFSSDYNNRAFSVTPVGATITPTLFFERYDQTEGHWLGFTRNEVRRDGLMFHTWDDEGERFFVGCHARFDRNISADGTINQGTWNGTSGKPEAGILTIKSGNTIWSGSDFLAIGDHISNSFTNVMARSFSQQSTLSSKTNIETVDPKYALDLVNRTDILSYQYKADVAQGKTKRYTSMILDDVNDVSKYYAPDEFANEERTGRDDGSAVGYLFLAVQELTRRIKNLEEKLHE